MKYIFAAAGLAAITLAAVVIARRRAARCPWTAAEARYARDRIDGLDVADPGAAYRTMFASLEQRRDS